jgi:transposase InsO family protein
MQLSVDYHLSLWAVMARETERVGYYTQQPWYLPSRIQESELDRPQAATESDWDMAERVGRVMRRMALKDPRRERIVRLYYGAYPGAEHKNKRERMAFLMHEVGETRRDVYRELDAAKQAIVGAIEYGTG